MLLKSEALHGTLHIMFERDPVRDAGTPACGWGACVCCFGGEHQARLMNEGMRSRSKQELQGLQAPITSCHIQFGIFFFTFLAPSPVLSAKYLRILHKYISDFKRFKLKGCNCTGCLFSFHCAPVPPPPAPQSDAAGSVGWVADSCSCSSSSCHVVVLFF